MEHRISDLLDCLEDAGQDLKPRGGNTARVRERTFSKLREAQASSVSRRSSCPLRVLVAAAAAVLLLCGTVFAAWKLGVFHFSEAMGPEGEVLDQWAVNYNSENAQPVAADAGYANWEKTQIAGYNIVLLELRTENGQLQAEVDISPKDESLPAFRDSGLSLNIVGYPAESKMREMGPWRDRVTLTATLEAPLPDRTALRLALTGPDTYAESKSFSLGYSRYQNPEIPSEYEPKIGTVAETKDYRFSLQTLAASESVLYAVLDVEGISDYGLAHLDAVPEIALSNHTHPGSSTLLDARLMESGDGVRRYMLGLSRNVDLNAEGDIIVFELLELIEEGDMAAHPYHLFDVELDQLVPEAVTTDAPTGTPASGTRWECLELDALGLTLQGSVDREAAWPPEVILIFRDGTHETVLDEDNSFYGQQAPMPEGHRAILTNAGGHRDGTDYLSLIFARPVDIEALTAVEVDGQLFSFAH